MKENNALQYYKNNKLFFKRDIIAFILLFILLALSVYFIANKTEGKTVEIYYKGELTGTYSLSAVREIVIDNQGYNKIVIKNNTVFMEEADCPDQLCVKSSPIKYVNQRIICSPNGIVLIIKGEEELDAISGGNYA